MHKWETRMLLKHYLDQGLTKAELVRRFGVDRRTIHNWIASGQLERDEAAGEVRYKPRSCRPHRAQTKGKVEWPIRYIRESFHYGRDFVDGGHVNDSTTRSNAG
ncbi:MAG: hypothetical protein OXJ90_26765 [Spirochaetaceae bacterium]|nr:hypothetical protein [Spirochaetaceae bacterium]